MVFSWVFFFERARPLARHGRVVYKGYSFIYTVQYSQALYIQSPLLYTLPPSVEPTTKLYRSLARFPRVGSRTRALASAAVPLVHGLLTEIRREVEHNCGRLPNGVGGRQEEIGSGADRERDWLFGYLGCGVKYFGILDLRVVNYDYYVFHFDMYYSIHCVLYYEKVRMKCGKVFGL